MKPIKGRVTQDLGLGNELLVLHLLMILVECWILIKVEAIHAFSEWKIVYLLNCWNLRSKVMLIYISREFVIIRLKIRVLCNRGLLCIYILIIL